MEKTINQQLDELFNEKWITRYSCEEKKKFVYDGLVYQLNKDHKDDWLLPNGSPSQAGKEADLFINQLWLTSPIRVAFVLKDKNTPDGDDTRKWLILDNEDGKKNRNLRTKIMRRLARLLYGLTVEHIGFNQLDNHKIKHTWETTPFAFIEAKKIAGVSSVTKEEMEEALSRDIDLLMEEIKILDPNILVCFDGEDTQFNYITAKFDKLAGKHEKIERKYNQNNNFTCCLYYYPTLNKVVIKSNHPCDRGTNWIHYEKVISPFRELMNDNLIKLK